VAADACGRTVNHELEVMKSYAKEGLGKFKGFSLTQEEAQELLHLHCDLAGSNVSDMSILEDRMKMKRYCSLRDRHRATAGFCCDCCKIDEKDLDTKSLMKCSICRMAFYCLEECQKMHWKEGGHKKYCRKLGQVEPGDVMSLADVEGSSDFGGELVKIINRVVDSEDPLWRVKVLGTGEELHIPAESLLRLRHLT
jgi:hypothetical protein